MDLFCRFLDMYGYWQKRIDNPRFAASMFRGRWMIYRIADQKMIARWFRNYESSDVRNMLVYLNGGTTGTEHMIVVPEKVARSKKQRLESLKAVHASFAFKKITMDVMYRQLKYYELPPKERAIRMAWIHEQAAKNEKERVLNKSFGRQRNYRGGVIMNDERDRQLKKYKW